MGIAQGPIVIGAWEAHRQAPTVWIVWDNRSILCSSYYSAQVSDSPHGMRVTHLQEDSPVKAEIPTFCYKTKIKKDNCFPTTLSFLFNAIIILKQSISFKP